MKKSTQFIFATALAVVGIILLSISRFSASADQLIPSNLTYTIMMVVGLGLTVIGAVWFYILATRN